MTLELINNKLIIDSVEFDLDSIKSISRNADFIKIKIAKITRLLALENEKEAAIVLNKINKLLRDKKNFIKCDKNIILNLDKVKSCTLRSVNKEKQEYTGIFNF